MVPFQAIAQDTAPGVIMTIRVGRGLQEEPHEFSQARDMQLPVNGLPMVLDRTRGKIELLRSVCRRHAQHRELYDLLFAPGQYAGPKRV
jgi:hypothetical protein